MEKAKQILLPFTEKPFSHTTIVSDYNALKAMWHYALQFGIWYSGMTEDKVRAALDRFEREANVPPAAEANEIPDNECPDWRSIAP